MSWATRAKEITFAPLWQKLSFVQKKSTLGPTALPKEDIPEFKAET
jgi:hypothetical protein